MSYLDSTKVQVYPSAFRGGNYNPESKLTTEFNVSTSTRKLSNKNFVMSDLFSADTDFEFSIHGYYFKVRIPTTFLDDFGSTATELYANIKISGCQSVDEDANTSFANYVLTPFESGTAGSELDSNNKFIGINFLETASSGAGEYSLLILKKVNGVWEIPDSSKLKFYSSEIACGTNEKGMDKYVEVEAENTTDTALSVLRGKTELQDTEISGDLTVKNGDASITGDISTTTGDISVESANKVVKYNTSTDIRTMEDNVLTNKEYVDNTTAHTIDCDGTPELVLKAKDGTQIDSVDLKEMLLNALYPVGSIYTCLPLEGGVTTCPIKGTLGGTWQQLKDVFMYAVESAYNARSSLGVLSPITSDGGDNKYQVFPFNFTSESAGPTGSLAFRCAGTGKNPIIFADSALTNMTVNSKTGWGSTHGLNMRGNEDGEGDTLTFLEHNHTIHCTYATGYIEGEDYKKINSRADSQTANMPQYVRVMAWRRVE